MNLIMGIQAYLSTGSLPSLYAAGGIGVILLLSTLLKGIPIIMHIVAGLASIALLGKFVPSYIRHTDKIYPDLIVILAAAFVLINLLSHYILKK